MDERKIITREKEWMKGKTYMNIEMERRELKWKSIELRESQENMKDNEKR